MAGADIECVVVGAGVVGLAVARALARAGRDVVVLEAEPGIGRGISARNSEVVHAGLYYAPGSRKARCCVAGKHLLYAFAADHGVPNRRCGKLVVATQAGQVPQLEALARRAAANGVEDLVGLTPSDVRALEPEVTAVRGLLSPSTGIVDAQALMLALRGDIEAAGGALALATPVLRGAAEVGAIRLETGGAAPDAIRARHVVLAGGLGSAPLARAIAGVRPDSVPTIRFAKGNYVALSGVAPFQRLVYPLPEPGGIGVHLTLDLAGRARFGPDVEWLETREPGAIDYRVEASRTAGVLAAIRAYWPNVPADRLVPDYAGVRPKLVGPGEPDADFLIQDEAAHGVAGLQVLLGIESPGLTSALALAEEVAARVC